MEMLGVLTSKPRRPQKFNSYMDHAYFSAIVLFNRLFQDGSDKKKKKQAEHKNPVKLKMQEEHLDALTAILMHNSLYKFIIAHYKDDGNIPFKPELFPLAYLLMLCDELQCWDRTAYGRNSKLELHPMDCRFDFSGNAIKATYVFDKDEYAKMDKFKRDHEKWKKDLNEDKKYKEPKLKAFSDMYKSGSEMSEFEKDIRRIVDFDGIKFEVSIDENGEKHHDGRRSFLSSCDFINLYNFAVVLNGRWSCYMEWNKAREENKEEEFISDEKQIEKFVDDFNKISLEYKLSNINQAKAFAKYLDKINCFYTIRDVDFDRLDGFTEQEMQLIGPMEHQRWLQEHLDMGWTYGEPKDKAERELTRRHYSMIEGFTGFDVNEEDALAHYKKLNPNIQAKDTEPMNCMLAMLRMFNGLRIYRLK